MQGRKFTILFLLLIAVSGVGASLWIKQAYDTRPIIKIEEKPKPFSEVPQPKTSESN